MPFSGLVRDVRLHHFNCSVIELREQAPLDSKNSPSPCQPRFDRFLRYRREQQLFRNNGAGQVAVSAFILYQFKCKVYSIIYDTLGSFYFISTWVSVRLLKEMLSAEMIKIQNKQVNQGDDNNSTIVSDVLGVINIIVRPLDEIVSVTRR